MKKKALLLATLLALVSYSSAKALTACYTNDSDQDPLCADSSGKLIGETIIAANGSAFVDASGKGYVSCPNSTTITCRATAGDYNVIGYSYQSSAGVRQYVDLTGTGHTSCPTN